MSTSLAPDHHETAKIDRKLIRQRNTLTPGTGVPDEFVTVPVTVTLWKANGSCPNEILSNKGAIISNIKIHILIYLNISYVK